MLQFCLFHTCVSSLTGRFEGVSNAKIEAMSTRTRVFLQTWVPRRGSAPKRSRVAKNKAWRRLGVRRSAEAHPSCDVARAVGPSTPVLENDPKCLDRSPE